MKKYVTFLLLLSLLASCMVSCSNTVDTTEDTQDTADTTPVETEPETDYIEGLGSRDFGGATYQMAGISEPGDGNINFAGEEQNGNLINDALFNRDAMIEESYNVDIQSTSYNFGADGTLNSDMQKLILAGDDKYDLVVGSMGSTQMTLLKAGMLYDLNSLPTIDLTNPWWCAYANTNLQIGGKLYATTGDMVPIYYYIPYVMCYNMQMAENYGIDMYEMVMDGKWTLDKFAEFAETFTQDLDGDGEITPEDQIAYAHVRTQVTTWSHYVGCGMQLNSLDEDGNILIDLANDNSVTVIQKLQDIFTTLKSNYFDMDTATPMFLAGKSFLFGNSMATVVTSFREMEDDYAFLPCPKYDEAQEEYYTSVNVWSRGYVGVPKTISDPEKDGFIMEAMAYLSYRDVRSAAYDTVLWNKMSRTEESVDMLDLIYKNVYLDANYVFDFGGSASAIYEAVMNGKPFVSTYESVKQKIDTAIAEMEEGLQ